MNSIKKSLFYLIIAVALGLIVQLLVVARRNQVNGGKVHHFSASDKVESCSRKF